jgi:hypothetical protein
METTALAVVEPASLLESPLSPAETAELQSCELAIELAGKDRLEKALIIGEKLSTIYNGALFRGADGGCTWEQWLKERLPRLLPEATGKSVQWGDRRRILWEERKLLSSSRSGWAALPATQEPAEALSALIPRKFVNPTGWNPTILDDPDAAEGIAKVWELACTNAEANQRRNGPTAEDVRAAREELRPKLEQKGLIRSAPASFQAATAARVEAAQQRTVTVAAVDPAEQERKAAEFRQTMANIRDTKAERQASVEAQGVKDELGKAERERRHLLDEEVRHYNRCLHGASKAIHELLSYLESLSRIHGTQLLDEMRTVDVLGMITVSDDMDRFQIMATELAQAGRLARTSEPSTGMDATTINV